jgi:hypothetical protein
MRRAILARSDYYLDLFLVQADRRRRGDWILRSRGECNADLPVVAGGSLGAEGEGYQHVSDVRRAVVDGDFRIKWRSGSVGLILFAAGMPGAGIILGSAPGNPAAERQSLLIRRHYATSIAYLSVFHPYRQQARVTSVRWIERDLIGAGWAGLVVETQDARESWLIRLQPGIVPASEMELGRLDAEFEYCLDWPLAHGTGIPNS